MSTENGSLSKKVDTIANEADAVGMMTLVMGVAFEGLLGGFMRPRCAGGEQSENTPTKHERNKVSR